MKKDKKHTYYFTIKRVVNNNHALAQSASRQRTTAYSSDLSPYITASPEDYLEIGKARINELITDGKKPYKKETLFLARFLEYRLNRRQFFVAIDSWLSRQGLNPIDWDNLNFDPNYIRRKQKV